MEYAAFGTTGLQVSRFCLGTATFGGQCDEAASFALLVAADILFLHPHPAPHV